MHYKSSICQPMTGHLNISNLINKLPCTAAFSNRITSLGTGPSKEMYKKSILYSNWLLNTGFSVYKIQQC